MQEKSAKVIELVKIHDEYLKIQDNICTASLCSKDELIILTTKGEVFLYNMGSRDLVLLFETNPSRGIKYSDGGFDPMAESTIYTMDSIIVVVNDYKKHGFVLNRKEKYLLHISRWDYHASISKYPIALFRNDNGDPHLIYGVDWNHLQIANLTTRQILTADKSLIIENAEQQRIDFYKRYEERNKLLWPRSYDYFFARLIVSPNEKNFMSAGWVWGSFDYFTLYNINDFISNHRIKYTDIGGWEHNDRGTCFVDDETIGIIYNLDEEESCGKKDYEIRLYHTDGRGEKGKIVLNTPLNLNGAELFYRKENQCFYIISPKIGIAIISQSGEIVFQSSAFIPKRYEEGQNLFIDYAEKQIRIFQLK